MTGQEQTPLPLAEIVQANSYTSVVLIHHPGFDEITAKVLLERFLNTELEVHSFADSLIMTDAEIDTLETIGVFAIDLGANQYKKRSCRSATEVVAKEFGVELTEGETELVELAGQDNESGLLNKYVDAMSIPWTLRKVYEIDAYGANQEDVVARMSHVVHIWLRYKDRERDPLRDTADLFTEFPDLVEKFDRAKPNGDHHGDHQFNHFTALRYMRDMWHLGIPSKEIRERVNYWIEAWQKVKDAIAEGERRFSSLTPDNFSVGKLNGLVLESGDPFLNRAAACKCDILVAKNPETGHALIATHGLRVDRLAMALTRQEPEKWFSVRGWVVNGGLRNRGIEPTALTTAGLVELVKKFPPHK